MRARLDDRLGLWAVTRTRTGAVPGPVFAIWIGWRWLCRKGRDLPTHDPYKDLAFYDLAEEQMVDTPQDAHCLVVEDPRETVAELDRENQTLGGAIIRSQGAYPSVRNPRRLNAIESAQPQPVAAGEQSACLPSARPRHIHGHVQSPHFAQELPHSAANAFNLLEYCG
jgi:hypothetical protein